MGDIFDSIPDPYVALGVAKDADATAIKSAYRKLVLKCHPDKVSDPTLKQAASDKFHIIQTSYERLSDEKSRARYDAECKLRELKKERAQERAQRSGDERPVRSTYRSAQEVPRSTYARREPSPVVEERRPAYADYADASVRPPRREAQSERDGRPSRRQVPQSSGQRWRDAVKSYKENERSGRKEKAKRSTKDTRRERESKYGRTYGSENSDETDSDAYMASTRRAREVDEARRSAREDQEYQERRARAAYYEQAERQREQASNGYFDERTRRIFENSDRAADRAKEYTTRSRQPEAAYSSRERDHQDVGPKGESYRRSAIRTDSYGRESDSSPRAPPRERTGATYSDEASRPRPPPLNTSRSSPYDSRIPEDKPRAHSLQHGPDEFVPKPVQRATTMPTQSSRSRSDRPSRATEFKEGYPTPGATPEYSGPYPRYGRSSREKEYADDREYPTPDGYRVPEPYTTELREPPSSAARESLRRADTREMRSGPSPVREVREPRDVREGRERPISSRHASERPQTTPLRGVKTTSYKYDDFNGGSGGGNGRPPISRESSSRESPLLFNEIRPATSGAPPTSYAPYVAEERYPRPSRTEEIRTQSGYSVKRPSVEIRPEVSRSSSNAIGAR